MKIFLTILAMLGIVIGAILALLAIGFVAIGIGKLNERYQAVKIITTYLEKIGKIIIIVVAGLMVLLFILSTFSSLYQKLWGSALI